MIDPRQNMDHERGSSRCLGVALGVLLAVATVAGCVFTGCALLDTVTNSLPLNPACRSLSSRGDYKVGLIGLGQDARLLVDIFDFRVHTWWLDDSELMRTMQNGKQELLRRGIPKNKEF